MDVDGCLSLLGRFGRWQVCALVLLGLSANAILAWNVMTVVFIADVPDFICMLNQKENTSLSHTQTWAQTDQCHVLRNDINTSAQSCEGDLQYKLNHGPTIVSEWNLVCEQNYLVELSQMIFMSGLAISGFFITALSDFFGRKKAHIVSACLAGVVGIIVAVAPNYPVFTFSRFISGMLADGVYGTGMVWLTEHFSSHTRAFASSISLFFWCFTKCVLCLLAFLIPNWRYLQLTVSILSLAPITFIWLLDESVPWLSAMGKTKDAQRILNRAAKLNGIKKYDLQLGTACVISECKVDATEEERAEMNKSNVDTEVKKHDNTSSDKDNIFSVLRNPTLRRSLLLISFVFLVNNLAYHGVILALGNMAGSLHLNFLISSLMDGAGSAVVCVVSKRWGRLPNIIFGQLTAGVGLIISAFVPPITDNGTNLTPLITTTVMLSFLGSATTYATICAYAPEVFPTRVRNLSYGMILTFGRIGGITAPLYGYVGKYIPWLPAVCVGVAAAISGLTSLTLPETSKRPLFQTIAEMDDWLKNEKIKRKWKKEKKNQSLSETMI